MENKEYTIGTKVIMKKPHPCGRTVLIPRIEFNKKLKKIVEEEE